MPATRATRKVDKPQLELGNVTELRQRFLWYDYDDQLPHGEQARLLLQLVALYRRRKLLTSDPAPALCDVCENREHCWAEAKGRERRRPHDPTNDENGSVCLPWVGARYKRGGLVILGINPNVAPDDSTDLLVEHGISWKHITSFRDGKRGENGSRFGYASVRSAAALLDALYKRPVRDRSPDKEPDRSELIQTMLETARLQAIKCIPIVEDSAPYDAMWSRCPEYLLGDELDVLRPAILLVLGDGPREAISRLGFDKFEIEGSGTACFRHGLLRRSDWQADVYALHHPHGGKASEDLMIRVLQSGRRRPEASRPEPETRGTP